MDRKVEIESYLNERRQLVETALAAALPPAEGPFHHHFEAMRYSLLVGGKRLRPILCLAAGEAVADSCRCHDTLLPVACALECIHTYSLIHDDLPAMDNDDLRRGKPTNHILFGEAGAILAGDGLLTWAFELLSRPSVSTGGYQLSDGRRLAIIHSIARAAGSQGMVGGQALDIATENSTFPFSVLETIHRSKTGALITASLHVGAIGAGASTEQTGQLLAYGEKLGLAFQIVDDLLNATSTTEALGKAAGSDSQRGKATYPAFFGVEQTRRLARQAVDEAITALAGFDQRAEPLRALAEYVFTRSH